MLDAAAIEAPTAGWLQSCGVAGSQTRLFRSDAISGRGRCESAFRPPGELINDGGFNPTGLFGARGDVANGSDAGSDSSFDMAYGRILCCVAGQQEAGSRLKRVAMT